MRHIPQSSGVLLLGVFLLQIIGHHNGNANPALKTQQRSQEESSADGTEEALLGLGQPCVMSDECNSTLCCLTSTNGSSTCQMRPREAGQNCSQREFLTNVGDEGPYSYACPCGNGYNCNLLKAEQRNGDEHEDKNNERFRRGKCESIATTTGLNMAASQSTEVSDVVS
uniref:Ixodegrin B n=1 Tax=Rhipicephalus zambeziensis TaxID=60191 RepID=A0A224YD72_9ACAR